MCLYTQMSFSFCSDIQLFYYFLPVMAIIGAIVKVYKKKTRSKPFRHFLFAGLCVRNIYILSRILNSFGIGLGQMIGFAIRSTAHTALATQVNCAAAT